MKNITKLKLKTGAVMLVVGVLFILSVGLLSSVFIKGCVKINERGLKSIVEEVWEGKQSLGQ